MCAACCVLKPYPFCANRLVRHDQSLCLGLVIMNSAKAGPGRPAAMHPFLEAPACAPSFSPGLPCMCQRAGSSPQRAGRAFPHPRAGHHVVLSPTCNAG